MFAATLYNTSTHVGLQCQAPWQVESLIHADRKPPTKPPPPLSGVDRIDIAIKDLASFCKSFLASAKSKEEGLQSSASRVRTSQKFNKIEEFVFTEEELREAGRPCLLLVFRQSRNAPRSLVS